ncbi:MAG: N-acetyltransferase family protein [Acidimicrobiales bacterium]
MTAAEWLTWAAHIDRGYVDQMVEMGGMSRPAAEAKAAADWPELLPDGPLTPGHSYFVAESGGRPVATLWLGRRADDVDGDLVWVYDIEVEADVRGRGFGRAVMGRAEDEARAAGVARIGLNVFALNVAAIALYTSLGYRVVRSHGTGQNMLKDL